MTAAVPLHPYQQRWLRDRARFKIGMFARQTGKTFTTTLEIVDDCYHAWAEGRRVRWVILSRGERQAREAMREGVLLHARAYGIALESLSDYEHVADDGTRYAGLEAVLPGGSRVIALPANPDTARGYSASVFLDEFARHQDSRAIWAALFPVISAGHRIVVTSTPNGKANRFYELMTARTGVWSRHVVDIHQAVADGLPRDVDELRDGLADEEMWRQEYLLEWLDEASAWLTYDLIDGVEHPGAGDPEGYAGGVTYMGNDIARRGHLWVAWVVEAIGDVLWTREIRELRHQPFAVQDQVFGDLVARYDPARIAMDQTGMGEKPVEDMQRAHGVHRVEGVVLTSDRRLVLATHLRGRCEDRTLRIPSGDTALRADLHSVQRIVGPTGAVRLVAPDEGGVHADRFWAASLACGAAVSSVRPPAGETVPDDDHAGTYAPRALAGRAARRPLIGRPRHRARRAP